MASDRFPGKIAELLVKANGKIKSCTIEYGYKKQVQALGGAFGERTFFQGDEVTFTLDLKKGPYAQDVQKKNVPSILSSSNSTSKSMEKSMKMRSFKDFLWMVQGETPLYHGTSTKAAPEPTFCCTLPRSYDTLKQLDEAYAQTDKFCRKYSSMFRDEVCRLDNVLYKAAEEKVMAELELKLVEALDSRRAHWLECRALLIERRDERNERSRISREGTPEEVTARIEKQLDEARKRRELDLEHGRGFNCYGQVNHCPYQMSSKEFETWIEEYRRMLIEQAEKSREIHSKNPPIEYSFEKIKDEPEKPLERAWRYVEDIFNGYAIRNSKLFDEKFCGCNGYVTSYVPGPGKEFPSHIGHFRYSKDSHHADRVNTEAPENRALWLYSHFLGETWTKAIDAAHPPHPLGTANWYRF